MPITDQTLPAYITIAFDLDGKVKVRQLQERRVIKDGDTVINGGGEGELLPIRLITAPQKNDAIEATLKDALDAATAGALLQTAHLEAQVADLETAKQEAETERDRLRIIVDAFPTENPGPGSAADSAKSP